MSNTVMDGNNGHTCWADATNIYFIVGSGGLIAFDKTAFTSAGLTEASWDIYVRAFR